MSFSSSEMEKMITETLLREVESIFEILVFEAITFSIVLVTSSSTFSALAPGHGVSTSATFSGMSGSLRCGMWV